MLGGPLRFGLGVTSLLFLPLWLEDVKREELATGVSDPLLRRDLLAGGVEGGSFRSSDLDEEVHRLNGISSELFADSAEQ